MFLLPTKGLAWFTQRGFKLALAGLTLALGFDHAGAAANKACEPAGVVYLGTDGTSIRALRFDACKGELSMTGPVAEASKPRWISAHPKLPLVYAAVDGNVIAYAVDRKTAALTPLNQQTAGGAGTTHLWLDASSNSLLAANFGDGSIASLSIQPDGSLGNLVSTIKAAGSGPHRRQASPHAHGSTIDPSGRFALVADMGADRVFVYGFDRATHAVLADDAANPRSFVAPAGCGPRRAVFSSSSRQVYVLCELTAELIVLQWDGQGGRLRPSQTLPLSSAEFQGNKSSSEIAVSRDGRFAYVANRGENQLMVYGVDSNSGELTLLQRVASGGEAPWAFDIDASGRWLLVANFRSNRVNLFEIDARSGRLSDTGRAVDSPAPASVTFVN